MIDVIPSRQIFRGDGDGVVMVGVRGRGGVAVIELGGICWLEL